MRSIKKEAFTSFFAMFTLAVFNMVPTSAFGARCGSLFVEKYRITFGLHQKPKYAALLIDSEKWKTRNYARLAHEIINSRNSYPQEHIPFSELAKDHQRFVKKIWKLSWNSKVPRTLKTLAECERFVEVGVVQITTATGENYEKIVTANKFREISRKIVLDAVMELISENSLSPADLRAFYFFHSHPPGIVSGSSPMLSTGDFQAQQSMKEQMLVMGADIPIHIFSTSEVGDGMVTFHSGIP